MNYSKKILIIILSIIIVAVLSTKLPDESLNSKIKIGVSDDSSGLVINYMVMKDRLEDIELNKNFEPYFVKDC